MFSILLKKNYANLFLGLKVLSEAVASINFPSSDENMMKIIPISKKTKKVLESINEIRNGVVHKYEYNDARFNYEGKNVFLEKI